MTARLDAVLAAIDEINSQDPNTLVVDGVVRPKELAHSEMVSDWVSKFDADPTEEQLIAARAHHLRRWAVPRSDYPDGRSGYLRWRRELGKRHRTEVAQLMADCGYEDSAISAVEAIMAKRNLKGDPAAQAHEDALCMVFLETQLDELIDRLGPDRSAEVVAKTMAKMSESGLAAASAVDYGESGSAVLEQALRIRAEEV